MVWNQVQDLKVPKVYYVPKSCGDITSFLQSPLFCDEWPSRFVLHDAAINITDIYLIASRPPELHLLSPSDRWSSSLEIQIQEYNHEMVQSFHIDSIHGTQNASFVSTSEQPPQSISYTLTFFTWPNSRLTLQVKDH